MLSTLLTTKAILILAGAVLLVAGILTSIRRDAAATVTRPATKQEQKAVKAISKLGTSFADYNPK